MGRGTFYFDAGTFENAVAVFTNSGLTNCAPDGYYSDGINVRRQVNCVLLALEVCPDCNAPTATALFNLRGCSCRCMLHI